MTERHYKVRHWERALGLLGAVTGPISEKTDIETEICMQEIYWFNTCGVGGKLNWVARGMIDCDVDATKSQPTQWITRSWLRLGWGAELLLYPWRYHYPIIPGLPGEGHDVGQGGSLPPRVSLESIQQQSMLPVAGWMHAPDLQWRPGEHTLVSTTAANPSVLLSEDQRENRP